MSWSSWPPGIGWLCSQVFLSSTRAFQELVGGWGGDPTQTRLQDLGQKNLSHEVLAVV